MKALQSALLFILFYDIAASAQPADARFNEIFEDVMTCLDTTKNPCTEIFAEAMACAKNVKNDTLAASHYLTLGNARMRNGRWDHIALELFNLAHERNIKSGIACAIVESQFALTRYGRFKGETDSAEVFAERARKAAINCGNPSQIARAEVFLGSAYMQRSDYTNALPHFQEAEKGYLAIADSSGLGGLYLDMSILYSELHEKDRSRSLTKRASEIFKATGEEMKYAIALIDLSADLLDVKLADSALYYLPLAEAVVGGRHQRAEAFMEQNYGSAYYLLQDYQKAILHYQKGLDLIGPVGDKNLIIILHNYIAQCYREMGDGKNAYRNALISDSISKEAPKNFRRTKTYLELAESAFIYKKYDESYEAFKRYIALTDSLTGDSKKKEIAELEQAYEAEKRDNQILFHKQENALLEDKNTASTNRNYALGGCLLLLGISGYALIGKKNNKIKAQEASARLSAIEKEQLGQELAHKNRELTSKALYIAQNNQLLQELLENLKKMERKKDDPDVQKIVTKLKINELQESNWQAFTDQFNDLNPTFHKSLTKRYGNLTNGEMRLAALLRMGLGSKDIASMLGISEPGDEKSPLPPPEKDGARTRRKLGKEIDAGMKLGFLAKFIPGISQSKTFPIILTPDQMFSSPTKKPRSHRIKIL